MREIAISDIHGCRQTFRQLLHRLELTSEDCLYLLGDYIDRGPDSKGVIDTILEMQETGPQLTCLRGNHEQMLLNALHHPDAQKLFALNGGLETIQSYRLQRLDQFPKDHLNFLRGTAYHHLTPEYVLVHAGVNFRLPDPLSNPEALLWIRDYYNDLDRDWLDGRLLIHGHTPTPRPMIEKQFDGLPEFPILNIDCGCVFRQREFGLGYLCAVDLTNRQLYFQENIDS